MPVKIAGQGLRILAIAAFGAAWLALAPVARAVTGDDIAPGTACSNEDAVMVTANPAGTGGYVLTCEGGTWTATLTAADPTQDQQVATKKYVDDSVVAAGSCFADVTPVEGAACTDIGALAISTGGHLVVCKDGSNSIEAANCSFTGISLCYSHDTDGTQYICINP